MGAKWNIRLHVATLEVELEKILVWTCAEPAVAGSDALKLLKPDQERNFPRGRCVLKDGSHI